MARWSFHYPPSANLLQPFGAQRLESSHLGLNIIRLNIEMNATRMINLLDLYVDISGVWLESYVTGVLGILLRAARQTKRLAPEISCCLKVVRLTINDKSRQCCDACCIPYFTGLVVISTRAFLETGGRRSLGE